MRKFILTAAALFVMAVTAFAEGRAKYVFYFIGDGMGVNQVNGTETYLAAVEGFIGTVPLQFAQFPYTGFVTTFSGTNGVTDSAAAGTALATGNKTKNGVIGMLADQNTVVNSVAVWAKEAGAAVGVGTSVTVNHATPASFYAHRPDRNMYYEIGKDLITAGFDFYAGSDFASPENKNDATATGSLYDQCAAAGYTIARGYKDFRKKLKNADRIILFQQEKDNAGDRSSLAYAIDRSGSDMTLQEVTRAGISALTKQNKDGFFLMLEAGLVDKYSHPLDWARSVGDTIAFDKVVEAAQKYCDEHPDTLLIVTGDHTHSISVAGTVDDNKPGNDWREKVGVYANAGYPNYEDKDKDGFPDDFNPSKRLAVFFGAHPDYYETYRSFPDATFNPAVQNEKGQYVADARYKDVPSAHFVEGNLPRSESQGVHTVDDLVVTARGPNADQIRGFMNSTEIFRVMAEALALGR